MTPECKKALLIIYKKLGNTENDDDKIIGYLAGTILASESLGQLDVLLPQLLEAAAKWSTGIRQDDAKEPQS